MKRASPFVNRIRPAGDLSRYGAEFGLAVNCGLQGKTLGFGPHVEMLTMNAKREQGQPTEGVYS